MDQKNKIQKEILKEMKKIKIFTYEDLQTRLEHIPNSNLKNKYIVEILEGPSIMQIYGYYVFIY